MNKKEQSVVLSYLKSKHSYHWPITRLGATLKSIHGIPKGVQVQFMVDGKPHPMSVIRDTITLNFPLHLHPNEVIYLRMVCDKPPDLTFIYL